MTFIDKLKQKVSELEKNAQDILTQNFVEDSIQKSRYDICSGCEYFFSPSGNCKKCGCFMKVKTKLTHAKCPIGKW